jgi:hypothetical protein
MPDLVSDDESERSDSYRELSIFKSRGELNRLYYASFPQENSPDLGFNSDDEAF